MGLFGPPPSNMRPGPRALPPAPAPPQPEPATDPSDELGRLEAEAVEQLREAQAPFARLVRVDSDSILFISTSGRAMTGWRWRINGRVRVTYESGFRAWPSEWMWPREALDAEPSDVGKGAE